MRVEVLYVPGCPNFEPAVERVRKILHAQAVKDEIQTVPVTTATEAITLRFPGSPTIRVNGEDVESPPTLLAGLACRLYGGATGIPSEEAVWRAVERAKE